MKVRTSECDDCGRPIAYTAKRIPGYLPHAGQGLCQRCYVARRENRDWRNPKCTSELRITVCRRCDRQMMHGRRHPLPDGVKRYGSHGLCMVCVRVHSAGGGQNKKRRDGVDDVMVERAAAGWAQNRANVPERKAAAHYLDDHRYSAAQVAERLGICSRTVQRYRAERRRLEALAEAWCPQRPPAALEREAAA